MLEYTIPLDLSDLDNPTAFGQSYAEWLKSHSEFKRLCLRFSQGNLVLIEQPDTYFRSFVRVNLETFKAGWQAGRERMVEDIGKFGL